MNKLLTVSPSPHVKGDESIRKIMYGVVLAMLPAFAMSAMFFGWESVKVTLIAVAASVFFEYVIQKYLMKVKPTVDDGSAIVTGILLAFNVPVGLPVWLIVLGALVAIGVGKMSFGGLGQNPFNPALVGRVFLLISFPVQMTTWAPNKLVADGFSGATPLGLLKEGLKSGKTISEITSQLPNHFDLFWGNMSGSLGEISAVALLLGGLYMLWKKIISWHTPVAVLGTIFIFEGILWLANPERFMDPMFHLFTGGAMLGAIFMATDMVSSPMTRVGQLIFGVGIGIITVLIRNFGAYPEGISFAILIMNAFTPLINAYVKPTRFGRVA
ncbi:electron transport complex subunit D [Prolixibacter bellariivorans]|uniref:Ion-translocating oxidoreductase complex subunit D n=1 Tax=Prolixibacter bellariivorans TaxID=314319 RepID=A0A5M4B1C3_9BACT|nr:RnfABCDGE type electron transport complex subunit D [Prolixibacter bellariivorans]GET33686.1 electron transport complex subunit D [Prolixibacter bellariivorans]